MKESVPFRQRRRNCSSVDKTESVSCVVLAQLPNIYMREVNELFIGAEAGCVLCHCARQ